MYSKSRPLKLILITLPAIIFYSCALKGTSPESSLMKMIDMEGARLYYYNPDSVSRTDIQKLIRENINNQTIKKNLAKSLSSLAIETDEIKIFSMTCVESYTESHGVLTKISSGNFDLDFWKNHNKNKPADWNKYYNDSPHYNLIYYGDLKRSGDRAKGDVLVQKGITEIVIHFFNKGSHYDQIGYGAYSLFDESEEWLFLRFELI